MPTFGPYEVEAELGRGGMGRVFRARHLPTGATRALKVMTVSVDPDAIARFRREAAALARVGGRGVVPVHDAGVEHGQLWFAMELLAGGSLKALLRQKGQLPWRDAVLLARELAHVLARCHAAGVIHRDVKPDNVLLDESGDPWLADFGAVRDLHASRLTETGATLGTLAYMSPEQLLGEPVDGRSDVYALGILLHELVSGALPFEGKGLATMIGARKRARPSLAAHGAPAELVRVLDRALAYDRKERATAEELAAELEGVLAGRSDSSRPTLVIVLLVVAAASVGLVSVVWTRAARAQRVHAALETGRSALGRVLPEAEAAPLTSSGDAALELARASAEEVRQDRNASDADARAASDLFPEIALVKAKRDLRLGRPDDALRAIEGLDARDARARPVRARAREALGAARLAARDFAGARESLTRACELEPGNRTLRAERGAAAAAAGDDATALEDLEALARDIDALPRDQARNAWLAGLAPAVYRQALALGPAARLRRLDVAWRLAAPPAELATTVAEIWATTGRDLEHKGADRMAQSTGSLTAAEIADFRDGIELSHRAFLLYPQGTVHLHWQDWSMLTLWGRDNVATMERAFQGWPDHPMLEAVRARDAFARRDWTLCLTSAQNGLRHLPPVVDEASEEYVQQLAGDLTTLAAQAWHMAPDTGRPDLMTLGAERARSASVWGTLGVGALEARRDLELAKKCVERARQVERPLTEEAIPLIARVESLILDIQGRSEETIAVWQAADHERSTVETRFALAWRLAARKRWAEIAELEPPESKALEDPLNDTPVKLLVEIVRALCELRRRPEAEKLAADRGRAHPRVAEELEAVLAPYRK